MPRSPSDTYPLGDDVERYVAIEHQLGRLLDVGVIQPRLRQVYDWSATELGQPGLCDLLAGDVPCYAWPADDRLPWFPVPPPHGVGADGAPRGAGELEPARMTTRAEANHREGTYRTTLPTPRR